jgi:hypothetical protein
MGLDMYLSAKRSFFASSWDKGTEREKRPEFQANVAIRKTLDELGLAPPESTNLNFIELKTEVYYWRKANAIHSWFVRECQEGVDECQYTDIELEKLEELQVICADLSLAKSPKLALAKLPPISGFFFGSTEVDDWFWDVIRETAIDLAKLIAWAKSPAGEGWSFEYHSSW